jgi:hypothetical protein
METKFTPGPWTAGGTKPYKGNEAWIFDGSTPEKLIANVRPNIMDTTIPLDESIANSYLIAASPEMLAALQEFVKWAEFENKWDKCGQSYYLAIAAINKALNK